MSITERYDFLDNLRTFLIFMVVLIHAGVVYESSGIMGPYYNVYIVHMVVMGPIAVALLRTDIPVLLKYPLLAVTTYVASNLLVWATRTGLDAVALRRGSRPRKPASRPGSTVAHGAPGHP